MTIHSPKLRFTSSLPTKWSSGWNTIWPSYKLHQFLCDQMSRILLPNRKEGDDKWKQERARGSPNSQVKRKGDCRDPLKKARFQKTRRQKHGEVKVGRINNQPLDFQRESGITAGGDSLSCEPSRPHYKDYQAGTFVPLITVSCWRNNRFHRRVSLCCQKKTKAL